MLVQNQAAKMLMLPFYVDCSNQTAWRKANLACKLAIDNMEKDELLRSGENQSTRQRLVQCCSTLMSSV